MASLKHFVRNAWLATSYYSRATHLYHSLLGRKRGVISYHNILPISQLPPFDTYNVDTPADVFEQQIIFLKKYFGILPIEQISDKTSNGFFITIDDGMLNNAEILAPILAHHRVTALFAICPIFASGDMPYIWRDHIYLLLHQKQGSKILLPTNNYDTPFDITLNQVNTLTRSVKAYIYKHQIADPYIIIEEIYQKNGWIFAPFTDDKLRYNFMNWEQIKALVNQGHQIASHTLTHRVLRFLSAEEKEKELAESRQILQQKLAVPIDTLIYPYGSEAEIDQTTVKTAQTVGYKRAFMNIQNPKFELAQYALPRFALPPITNTAHLYGITSGYKYLFR